MLAVRVSCDHATAMSCTAVASSHDIARSNVLMCMNFDAADDDDDDDVNDDDGDDDGAAAAPDASSV
jgi:hypothetical protein